MYLSSFCVYKIDKILIEIKSFSKINKKNQKICYIYYKSNTKNLHNKLIRKRIKIFDLFWFLPLCPFVFAIHSPDFLDMPFLMHG
jgi:hypothetical protein